MVTVFFMLRYCFIQSTYLCFKFPVSQHILGILIGTWAIIYALNAKTEKTRKNISTIETSTTWVTRGFDIVLSSISSSNCATMNGPWMHSLPTFPLKPKLCGLKVDMNLAITSMLSEGGLSTGLACCLCDILDSTIQNRESDVP